MAREVQEHPGLHCGTLVQNIKNKSDHGGIGSRGRRIGISRSRKRGKEKTEKKKKRY